MIFGVGPFGAANVKYRIGVRPLLKCQMCFTLGKRHNVTFTQFPLFIVCVFARLRPTTMRDIFDIVGDVKWLASSVCLLFCRAKTILLSRNDIRKISLIEHLILRVDK